MKQLQTHLLQLESTVSASNDSTTPEEMTALLALRERLRTLDTNLARQRDALATISSQSAAADISRGPVAGSSSSSSDSTTTNSIAGNVEVNNPSNADNDDIQRMIVTRSDLQDAVSDAVDSMLSARANANSSDLPTTGATSDTSTGMPPMPPTVPQSNSNTMDSVKNDKPVVVASASNNGSISSKGGSVIDDALSEVLLNTDTSLPHFAAHVISLANTSLWEKLPYVKRGAFLSYGCLLTPAMKVCTEFVFYGCGVLSVCSVCMHGNTICV